MVYECPVGQATKAQFQSQFGLTDNEVCFVKCDVAIKDHWQDLWENAQKMLQGPIDILVNNAGVHPGVSTLILALFDKFKVS